VPSVRLKSYLRGQQDVEYLVLLSRLRGQSQLELGGRVRDMLKLRGEHKGTGFVGGEDAGVITFDELRPQDLWALRVRVGEVLSNARPEPLRRVVDFRTPRRDPAAGAGGYVTVGEFRERPAPGDAAAAAEPEPAGPVRTTVLQGPDAVRDALIDPAAAAQNFGDEARNNRLYRGEQTNALLVRFDLAGLGLPPGAEVRRATVHFYVWDPSTRGRTRVAALPLLTAWDESAATWARPAEGAKWTGPGGAFAVGADTAAAGPSVVLRPDLENDTADPPVEYTVDATAAVRDWLAGRAENHGLALAPVIDRSADAGEFSRVQVFASEHRDVQFTPKLTVDVAASP
jgi:hypothetical protein